jgi:hypothetical protein
MPVRLREGPEPSRSDAAIIAVLVGALGVAVALVIRLFAGSGGRRSAEPAGFPGAGVSPSQPHSNQQPGPRLAPEADSSPRLAGWYGVGALAFALICAGIAILGYDHYSHSYPPARFTVSASSSTHNASLLGDLQLSATGNGAPVRWLVAGGYLTQLTVNGPDGLGTAEVVLPLPQSMCKAIASRLSGTCARGNVVSISSPATFAWSSPQQIGSTNGSQVTSSSLDITPSIIRPGVSQVDVSSNTNDRPSLCFSSPMESATLTLTSGPRSFSQHFAANGPQVECTAGIPVLIGLSGRGLPPEFEFGGISTLLLQAVSPAGTLDGYAGQLELSPGGTTVLGVPTNVAVCAARDACQDPIVSSFEIGSGGQTQKLSLQSRAATSVITNDGELVPSQWSRRTDIYGPLLGGFITVLVVGPLGMFVQAFMDATKRWQGPFKRRARRAK